MYSKVAVSLTSLAPLAVSLKHDRLSADRGTKTTNSQPGVHKMWACVATAVEEGIHGDFPETGKFRFTFTDALNCQTVIGQAMIEGVRPVGVGAGVCNGDRGGDGRVIQEFRSGEHLECIDAIVEVRRSETFDG